MNDRSFLPDFCNVRMAFAVVLLAELLAIILTLAQASPVSDPLLDLALFSLFTQWIALCCAASLCLSRRYLNRLGDQWAATFSYLLILLVSLLISELAWRFLLAWPEDISSQSSGHGAFLLRCLGISAIAGALALRYFYVQHQWRRNIQLEARARFEALQARIRPHFLFNCMNTIASLTRKSPTLAEAAIEDLADLFRASLKDSEQLSTLKQELDLCRRYLNIETHRLGDRLQTQWDIDHLPEDIAMPALTLQPLLENAIYHGIEPRQAGGTIHIRGNIDGDRCIIEIQNPLPMEDRLNHKQGNRLAQDNIRQRLATTFAEEGHFAIDQQDDRYTVRITVPLRHEDSDR